MQGLSYNVDIVFCIDATASMSPVINEVKERALRFHSDLNEELSKVGKTIDELRAKVVVFRDYYVDGDDAMDGSEFWSLANSSDEFDQCIRNIKAKGGGDEPENGMEALAIGTQI